jgi:predicted PurR-regulated permease PerM
MLSSSVWRPFPRYLDEPELEEHEPDVTLSQHDLIVRYAILGIFVILATAALYLTKAIAMPIVAGVIFGLVLGPIVDSLVRRGVPQHLAAAVIVLAGLAVMMGAIAVLAVPIAGWSDQAPKMFEALHTKLVKVFAFMDEFKRGLAALAGKNGAELNVSQGNPLMDLAMSSSTAAGGMLVFVATVYFWLATRRHLKARLLRLCLGHGARKSAGAFFEEIEARCARYFGLVTLINIGMGLAAMGIAWLAGLPYPVFWGALAFLLNYLAFIGPIIVMVTLFAGSLLDAPTLIAAFAPAATYFVLHLIEGNAITPVVVGRQLTISPFLVFIGFIFWLWLWGPVGAVLSTPILLVATVAQEEFSAYRKAQEESETPTTEISATAAA